MSILKLSELETQRLSITNHVIESVEALVSVPELKDLVKIKVSERTLDDYDDETMVEIDLVTHDHKALFGDVQIRGPLATENVVSEYDTLLANNGEFTVKTEAEVISDIKDGVHWPLTDAVMKITAEDLLRELAGETMTIYGRLKFGTSGHYGVGFFRTMFTKDRSASITISNFTIEKPKGV